MNIILPSPPDPEAAMIFVRDILPHLKLDKLQQYHDRHKNRMTEYDQIITDAVKRKMEAII